MELYYNTNHKFKDDELVYYMKEICAKIISRLSYTHIKNDPAYVIEILDNWKYLHSGDRIEVAENELIW